MRSCDQLASLPGHLSALCNATSTQRSMRAGIVHAHMQQMKQHVADLNWQHGDQAEMVLMLDEISIQVTAHHLLAFLLCPS
jgi:hypothetical protein